MIHIPCGMKLGCSRFHQAAQNVTHNVKKYESFISGIFHLIVSDHGSLKSQKVKLRLQGTAALDDVASLSFLLNVIEVYAELMLALSS